MMNAGHKRLKLLLLTLAILACGVVALGGTLATQVRKSDDLNTTYKSNLVLDYNISLTYTTADNQTALPFLSSAPFSNTPWCPGYTKVVFLTVRNNEKFPVECIMTMDVDNDTLGRVMAYAVIDAPEGIPGNWRLFKAASARQGYLSDEGATVFNIPANSALSADQSRTYALAIHMDETATNAHQKQTMNLSFNMVVNADFAPGTIFDAAGNPVNPS